MPNQGMLFFMFKIKYIMQRIVKQNGYVYLVDGEDRFPTYYNLGKDPDDDRWADEINELKEILKK